MGAGGRDIRHLKLPRGQTSHPARPHSLIWFQQTGRDDGHASQSLWFLFFLITSLCFHTALLITNRPHFVPVLGEGSICNVIAQMKIVERWTDTNPLFLPVSSIIFSDFCGSSLSRLSLPEAKKTPLTPFCFFPSKREEIGGTIDNICSAMCKWVQIKLNTYNKSIHLRFYSTDFHFTIKKQTQTWHIPPYWTS